MQANVMVGGHAPAPQVVMVNNGGGGNCPACHKGTMTMGKKCGIWTWVVCYCCWPGLCCDCAWAKQMKCMSCGHTKDLK